MAWRYRKSIKLFPGVRLNLSKRGISTTVGVRGASVNFSKRGTYVNTGIPGTGLYNRVKLRDRDHTEAVTSAPTPHIRRYKHRLWPWMIVGTIAVGQLQSGPALLVFWFAMTLIAILRAVLHKDARALTPETASPVNTADAVAPTDERPGSLLPESRLYTESDSQQ